MVSSFSASFCYITSKQSEIVGLKFFTHLKISIDILIPANETVEHIY